MKATQFIAGDMSAHLADFDNLFENVRANTSGLVDGKPSCEHLRPDIQTTVCAITQMLVERAVDVGVQERGGVDAPGAAADATVEAVCAIGSGVGAFLAGLPDAAAAELLHKMVQALVTGKHLVERVRAGAQR